MKISSHYGNEKQIRRQIIKSILKLMTEKMAVLKSDESNQDTCCGGVVSRHERVNQSAPKLIRRVEFTVCTYS